MYFTCIQMHNILYVFYTYVQTSRHQSVREETKENKKTQKLLHMFDSEEFHQDRSQGLKKTNIEHSRI